MTSPRADGRRVPDWAALREDYGRGGSPRPTWPPTRSRCSTAWLDEAVAAGSTSPTRWCSRPPTPRDGPRAGWSCSRASGRTASCSSPTTRRARARSSPPTRAARCSSRGTRSSARCASRGSPRCSTTTRSRPTSHSRPAGPAVGAWASHQSRRCERSALAALRLGGGALRAALRRDGEVPVPRRVGRLSRRPEVVRVLAGPSQPDARPAGLPPHGLRLDHRAPRALTHSISTSGGRESHFAQGSGGRRQKDL